jgi:L-asparaginase / beta-aspartyl-peptidase
MAGKARQRFGLAVHGGAGRLLRAEIGAAKERAYRRALQAALDAGYAVLDAAGPALDAVTAAVAVLEDCPLFNAGRGAAVNADGICELDAAVMVGSTRAAGAVAGLQHVRNPIGLARAVMEKSGHVMMIGAGAESFAQEHGIGLVENAYFQTAERRREMERIRREAGGRASKWGTVGCVALDRSGGLAAGTSTGGMANKRFGRVGDSPLIGAGTYADDGTCAVSATGHGEYFIRAVAAREVSARMEYLGEPLARAASAAMARVAALGGSGGLIALDRRGNVAMPFDTPGMHRGFRLSGRRAMTAVFGPR